MYTGDNDLGLLDPGQYTEDQVQTMMAKIKYLDKLSTKLKNESQVVNQHNVALSAERKKVQRTQADISKIQAELKKQQITVAGVKSALLQKIEETKISRKRLIWISGIVAGTFLLTYIYSKIKKGKK